TRESTAARFNSRSLIPVLFNSASFGGLQFRGHFYPGQMGTLSSGRNSKELANDLENQGLLVQRVEKLPTFPFIR
ncbi:MAG TPA: hypothetical protein VKO18_00935, partial [Terriglobia bacterium]|nr:hypothetical protein [Terriglobia bacterium]